MIDRFMSQNIQGFQDVQQRLQHQNNLDMLQGSGSMQQQFHNIAQQQHHHLQQQHQPQPQYQQQQQQQQQQHQHQQQQHHHQQQQHQQQQQPSPSFPGSGLTPAMLLPNQPFGMLPQGGNSGSGSNFGCTGLSSGGTSNQGNFDVTSELKRLQRLQQQFGGQAHSGQNPLLFPDANSQMNQSSMNNQATLLQQMLDQQKLQNNNLMSNSNCFNPIFAQPGLLQDARLLLAQSQFAGMVPGQNNEADTPLPSPHSLFHRDGSRRMRGGVIEPFPEKLHRLLTEVEAAGRSDVISFVANGRAFAIHKPDKFFKEIVPLYFRQSRLSSFKRQLNLYGFELINTGPSRGGYFHELFVKDRPDLCRRMRRVAVKVSAGKGDKDDGDNSGNGKKAGQDSEDTADERDIIGSIHLPTNNELLHRRGDVNHEGPL